MAKNWTMGEAAHAVREMNKEAILDLGHRFPLTTVLLSQINDAGVALCDAMPEYVTVRKIEAILKGDATVAEDTDAQEEIVEAPAKKVKEKPAKEEKKAPKKVAKKPVIEDEDDEDEEEEEPAPKKAKKVEKKVSKKEEKKPAKKAAKKVEEDEDEDDDFDDFDFDDDDDE